MLVLMVLPPLEPVGEISENTSCLGSLPDGFQLLLGVEPLRGGSGSSRGGFYYI